MCIKIVTAQDDDFNSSCRESILFFWKVLDVEAAQVDQIKKWVISKLDIFLVYFLLVLTPILYPALIFNWNPWSLPGLFLTDPQIANFCLSNLTSMLKAQLSLICLLPLFLLFSALSSCSIRIVQYLEEKKHEEYWSHMYAFPSFLWSWTF